MSLDVIINIQDRNSQWLNLICNFFLFCFVVETIQVLTYGTHNYNQFVMIVSSKENLVFSLAVKLLLSFQIILVSNDFLQGVTHNNIFLKNVLNQQADGYAWIALSALPGITNTETTLIGIGIDDAFSKNVIMYNGEIKAEKTEPLISSTRDVVFWIGML